MGMDELSFSNEFNQFLIEESTIKSEVNYIKMSSCMEDNEELGAKIFSWIEKGKMTKLKQLMERFKKEDREEEIFDLENTEGDTMLHHACKKTNKVEMIKYLAEYKADFKAKNRGGETCLHNACWNTNNIEIIKFLILEMKCDIYANDDDGDSPLDYAVMGNGSVEIIKFLVEEIKVEMAEDSQKNSPLHISCSNNESLDIISYIYEKYPDNINTQNKYGNTPLHCSCWFNRNTRITEFLLEKKSDLNILNNEGTLPFGMLSLNENLNERDTKNLILYFSEKLKFLLVHLPPTENATNSSAFSQHLYSRSLCYSKIFYHENELKDLEKYILFNEEKSFSYFLFAKTFFFFENVRDFSLFFRHFKETG
eukprot:TRINITY_DN5228_c0_g1_i1.p1 TRINITY_DN5228_c0_g1~~TRINITY_DN5228_c0_g1_i1.p1  ORF type:complete len:376 (+),score=95.71 TRINITY_DN5228_c0_g1_i1:30-1130(+)